MTKHRDVNKCSTRSTRRNRQLSAATQRFQTNCTSSTPVLTGSTLLLRSPFTSTLPPRRLQLPLPDLPPQDTPLLLVISCRLQLKPPPPPPPPDRPLVISCRLQPPPPPPLPPDRPLVISCRFKPLPPPPTGPASGHLLSLQAPLDRPLVICCRFKPPPPPPLSPDRPLVTKYRLQPPPPPPLPPDRPLVISCRFKPPPHHPPAGPASGHQISPPASPTGPSTAARHQPPPPDPPSRPLPSLHLGSDAVPGPPGPPFVIREREVRSHFRSQNSRKA